MIRHHSWVNRAAHTLKVYLSRHISTPNLKFSAFIIALLSCLCSGSILLFSLFSLSIHETLGLSYVLINFISSLSALGMYLCLPILGYLADCYGPSILSILSVWFYIPSYYFAAKVIQFGISQNNNNNNNLSDITIPIQKSQNFYLYSLGGSFFCVGLATSALFFLSLLTCAKIYPDYKGLSISLPVSCFGLSSLLLSQLLKLNYFHLNHTKSLDLIKVFKFFTYLYLIVGFFHFMACSIVSIESKVLFGHDESTPLLQDQQNEESDDDDDELIPSRALVEPNDHKQRFSAFLRDPSAWIFLISLLINVGPMESFQNNLGSIIQNVRGPEVDLADQVSLMATSSTITRIAIGLFSDYLSSESRKYPICRIWLLSGLILLGGIGQILPMYEKSPFGLVSIFSGATYGGLFTIYPTIVATIWGIDIMGSTWGSFMVAPALGSVGYSLFYGWEVDTFCSKGQSHCLVEYFAFTSFSFIASLVLILIAWRVFWWKRGFAIF